MTTKHIGTTHNQVRVYWPALWTSAPFSLAWRIGLLRPMPTPLDWGWA